MHGLCEKGCDYHDSLGCFVRPRGEVNFNDTITECKSFGNSFNSFMTHEEIFEHRKHRRAWESISWSYIQNDRKCPVCRDDLIEKNDSLVCKNKECLAVFDLDKNKVRYFDRVKGQFKD